MNFDERLDCLRESMGIVEPTTVKQLCENLTGKSSENGNDHIEIIQDAVFKVFNFDFPMYDEGHRQELETKILKHYYFRQICSEDVGEWKLRLSEKLNLIMPYYMDLFYSKGFLTDILNDVDYSRTVKEDTTRNGMENSKSNQTFSNTSHAEANESGASISKNKSKDTNRISSTPQGSLSSIEDNTYLTSANIEDIDNVTNNSNSANSASDTTSSSENENTTNSINTDSGKRDMTEHVSGKMGTRSKAELVMEYRKTIVNIDNEIIARLADLFLTTYTPWRA